MARDACLVGAAVRDAFDDLVGSQAAQVVADQPTGLLLRYGRCAETSTEQAGGGACTTPAPLTVSYLSSYIKHPL